MRPWIIGVKSAAQHRRRRGKALEHSLTFPRASLLPFSQHRYPDIVILAALRRDERRAGLWNSSATVRLTAAVIITGEPLRCAKCLTGSCPEELAAFMALVTDGQKRDAALHGKCQIPTSRTYKLFPPLRQALPGLPEVSVMSWGLILAKRSWLGSRPRKELAEGLPFRF